MNREPESLGLLSLRQATRYLGGAEGNGPSYETLKYWTFRLRLFPTYKLGSGRGHTYLKRSDLDAFVEQGRQPKAAELLETKRGRQDYPPEGAKVQAMASASATSGRSRGARVERGSQSAGPSLREQARELLEASDRRAELRNQRRVERLMSRRATVRVIKLRTPAPPEGSA